MDFQVHTDFESFDPAEWNALVEEGLSDVPFLRHEYLSSWWHTRGGGEWQQAELVLVSAGFDAHMEDPLASMRVSVDGFREMARRCRSYAPRLAAVLEGGYELEMLPRLVDAALDGFTS